MINLTATGTTIRLIASSTFPAGIEINQWADDADPLDSDDLTVSATGVALNGDLVYNKVPQKFVLRVSVLPNTDECKNLDVLALANTESKGKPSVHDIITAVISYPDGTKRTLTSGVLTSAPSLILGATAEGRMKTRTYAFEFEVLLPA